MSNSENQQAAAVNLVVQDLVEQMLKERRRDRRWRNLRFFAIFSLIAVLAIGLLGKGGPAMQGAGKGGYVSLLYLDGMIGPQASFSAQNILPLLEDAFSDKQAKGVIIDINSGGGTPVQAAIIHDEIIRLKNKHHKKVIVVGEDMLASGAYYVAVSADKIYVNPNTVTGSIGVIMEGFGLNDVVAKLGVERRVYTSGDHKDRLDMFLPTKKEDVEKILSVLDEVHENFNQAVLQGRQGKLHADPKDLFTGDFWSGQTALKLGLVDALGNLSDAMQNEFNVSSFRDYSMSGNVLQSVLGKLGATLNLPLGHADFRLLEKI